MHAEPIFEFGNQFAENERLYRFEKAIESQSPSQFAWFDTCGSASLHIKFKDFIELRTISLKVENVCSVMFEVEHQKEILAQPKDGR